MNTGNYRCPEESTEFPEAGVMENRCELPDVSIGNYTQVLWKRSQPLNY